MEFELKKNSKDDDEKSDNIINHKVIKTEKSENLTNIKPQKKRNPGIDLVRLIAMYGVVLDHLLYVHGGMRKYKRYLKYLKLLHITIGWHNDGFALISGIVGYKSFKYANLLYLWLYVFFYCVGINLFFKIFKKINSNIAIEYFPVVYKRYWYFTAYFGMYLLLPIINKGISILTKFEFTLVVISTIGILVIWKDIKNPNNDVFKLHYGMTVLWILIIYILGAYIGKYGVIFSGKKRCAFCFICLIIYLFSCFLFYKVYHNELYLGNGYYQKNIVTLLKQLLTDNYNGLSKTLNSVIVILFFMQIQYNKYIAQVISFLAPQAFGVYLIHENNIIKKNILKYIFDKDPYNISLISTIILVLLKALKIFIICIIIDYFRNLLFNLMRIKKFCIYLEVKINKKFT